MFKTSKFNFWATITENQHLLFNGISGALYELDAQERVFALRLFELPNETLNNSNKTDLSRSLVEGGFIIPSQIDEIEILLIRNQIECVDHHILDLVIAPTYNCNFRCTYCYVEFKAERMSQDVEERIVKYIEQVLPQYHQVNIIWFGGEPLLCLDTILRISKKSMKIATHHNVQFHNFITSNGYLLKLDTAYKLFEVGIRFFHITIDGPSECHDQLRVLAGGRSSYAQIMKNLKDLLTHISKAHVTLRMNTNENNVASLYKVLDDIPADFRRRIQVNIFPIVYGGKTPSIELHRKINQVIQYALESGYLYYDIHIPVKRRTFCSADKHNNFQIGFDGTLYKCSPATKKPEVKVGRLNTLGEAELHHSYETWHEASLVSDHCLDCPYLCFCAGGCRLERLRKTKDLSCRDEYQDMGNLIINRYIAILNDAIDVKI